MRWIARREVGVEGEAFVDAVTDDPGDLIAGADERNAIAVASGHFGVDENVLELLLASEAEGAKAVAGAAGANGQVGDLSCRRRDGLPAGRRYLAWLVEARGTPRFRAARR